MIVKTFLFAILLQSVKFGVSFRDCKIENRMIKYYKIKSCHKSTSTVIFWKRVNSLEECKTVARERSGLAFNYSPPEAENFTAISLPNCHVLGCPETGNDSTLTMDLAYDYYSAYGNLNATQNATCIKSLGLFSLTNDYNNYSQAILSCQNSSGDLADVTTEYRTVMLSQIIKDGMVDWYKAAYVDLDDMQREGVFRTSLGKLLTCSNYRAWAPGHPRSKNKLEDCVTLDSDRLWRVVHCDKVKLRGLCEVYPQSPDIREKIPKNISCEQIPRRRKAITETWLTKDIQSTEMFQSEYTVYRTDRNYGVLNCTRGGGTLIAVRSVYDTHLLPCNTDTNFEDLWILLRERDVNIIIRCVYFLPNTSIE